MSKLRCHISISLDGFVAGPNQSEENPLGEGGERLHDWVVPLAAWRQSHGKEGGEENESARVVEESRENVGAGVMDTSGRFVLHVFARWVDAAEEHVLVTWPAID